MTAIIRKGFCVLYRDSPGWYIITNDGWYQRGFAADSDEDAIAKAGWRIPVYA